MVTQKASKYSSIVSALVALTLSTSAFAQTKKSKPAPAPAAPPAAASTPAPEAAKPVKDEKVDISDLENKYWAPKDTDFSVVQNRTYSKQNRFLVTPQWGTPINDAYSKGTIYGGTLNYFWSERFGIQATYLKADLDENDNTKEIGRLSATAGAYPDHGELTGYYGLGLNIVPFYAKMSLWGTRIIYFDMAFTPTVGMTSYDQVMEGGNKNKSSFSYGLDVTQFFFFNRWFAVRADLKNQWRSEEVVKYRNSSGQLKGQKVTDKMVQDTVFLLGATFYF